MIEFLRMFGQGIFYTIISPFLLLIWLLYLVYIIFITIFYEFKNFFLFFSGRSLRSPNELDLKLAEKKKEVYDNIPPSQGGVL